MAIKAITSKISIMYTVDCIPILSAILPISMPVMPASPAERPITSEEARLKFLGNKSCDMLIQSGMLEIRKKPEITNKITPTFTGVINIKNNIQIKQSVTGQMRAIHLKPSNYSFLFLFYLKNKSKK